MGNVRKMIDAAARRVNAASFPANTRGVGVSVLSALGRKKKKALASDDDLSYDEVLQRRAKRLREAAETLNTAKSELRDIARDAMQYRDDCKDNFNDSVRKNGSGSKEAANARNVLRDAEESAEHAKKMVKHADELFVFIYSEARYLEGN